MKISFISLNVSGSESVQSAADQARKVLSSFGETAFKVCDSLQQISASLTDAFASSDVTVLGVETSVYTKAKLAILRAMHITTEENEEVRERLGERGDLSDKQYSAQITMPVEASVFLTSDGLYSGFAIKAGKQRFVFIALDKLRMDTVFGKGLVPYLDSCAISDGGNEDEPADVPETNNCIDETVELLRSYSTRVYFASTPSGEIVKSLCRGHDIDDALIFTDYSAPRNGEAPRSYIADLARYAIPENTNHLGAAVSNVFTGVSNETGEQKYNIYVSVSDANVSRVLRFSSQPGETPEELVQAAVEMLMDMICEKCKANAESDYLNGERIEKESEDEKRRKKRNGAGIVFLVILALIIACIVGLFVKGRMNVIQDRDSAVSYASTPEFEAIRQPTTTEPPTTAKPRPTTTAPAVEDITPPAN